MRKSNAIGISLLLLASFALASEAPPTKKLTLQDVLKSGTSSPQASTPTISAANFASLDTKARDFAAIDRLELMVVHDNELKEFMDEGNLVWKGAMLTKPTSVLPDAVEIKVGREVAANLAARFGLVEDAGKVRYVNMVGQALASHSARKKIPYHFGILHTSEINAIAAPGGYIFITEGLLITLKDESELAGVLAHEVTHVVRRHIFKAIQQANLDITKKDTTAAADAQLAQLSDFSINLLNKGFSRHDELDADKGATLLAARIGYDPKGLRRSVESLAAMPQAGLFLGGYKKTHPAFADRLAIIDRTIQRSHLTKRGQKLPLRFRKNLAA
jgi:predicted Zn-dependent protease